MATKKASCKKTDKKKKEYHRLGGPKGPRSRPISDQDFLDFEELCNMQCTQDEIAAFFKCDADTLASRIKSHYKANFSVKYKELRSGGKASLRRVMWNKAMGGDGQTQRWLSRQYLGMSDKVELDDKRQTDDTGKVLAPAERLKLIHGDRQKA